MGLEVSGSLLGKNLQLSLLHELGEAPSHFQVQYCSAGALCLESEPQTHGESGGNEQICWDLSKAAPTLFWVLGEV